MGKNGENKYITKAVLGIIAMIVCTAIFSSAALAEISTVNPLKDATVSSAMPNTNYGTEPVLKVRANLFYPRRTLIGFQNMPAIPPNYLVNRATLSVYVDSVPWGLRTYAISRAASSWNENLVTWKNQPGAASQSNTSIIAPGWVDFDVTTDVRGFYNGTIANNGFVIADAFENSIFTQESIILSKESADPFKRPKLTINYCVDFDGDGYFAAGEGCTSAIDCNDHDALIRPDAVERCNNIDDDCDGIIDENVIEQQACGSSVGECRQGTSNRICNAGAFGPYGECTGAINPVAETCDGLDNDCNGIIDEENSVGCTAYYFDNDSDSYGTADSKCLCAPAGKYTASQSGDCNDANPSINPETAEICDNIDNNCDGIVDEEVSRACYTGPAGTSDVGICRHGTQSCTAGTWNSCIGQILQEQEICGNGIDENCNGRDEPCYGAICISTDIPSTVISGEKFAASVTLRNAGEDVWTQFYSYRLGSQNPANNVIFGKDRIEIDNGIAVHQSETYTFNFNLTAPSVAGTYDSDWQLLQENVRWIGEICSKRINVVLNCTDNDEDGHYAITAGCPMADDCNDADANVNPDVLEQCNSIDDNCDGIIDESCSIVDSECIGMNVPDEIIAGRTATAFVTMKNTGTASWSRPQQFRLGSENPENNVIFGLNRAHLDEDVTVRPGEEYTFDFEITAPAIGTYDFEWRMVQEGVTWFGETCKRILVSTTNCMDNDNDNFYGFDANECPSGNDCNDFNADVNPDAAEACNLIDDNCNGIIDDENAIGCTAYYYDSDSDNYGTADSKCLCEEAGKYAAAQGGDCNDAESSIYPGANEKCNGIDDNCNGQIDEFYNIGTSCTAGVGACTRAGTKVCADDASSVCNAVPGAPSEEICDNIDNDCDGSVDENLLKSCYTGTLVTEGIGICRNGTQTCSVGAWGTCIGEVTPKPEQCNELDDNCDGSVDETCIDNDASCLANTVPSSMLVGETRPVTMTMKNLGKNDWIKGSDVLMITDLFGITMPVDIFAGDIVYTGSNYTFSQNLVAPPTTGIYGTAWQMSGSPNFGQVCSKDIAVVVRPLAGHAFFPGSADGTNGWYKTKPRIVLTPLTPGASIYYHWNTGTENMFTADIYAPEGFNTLSFYAKDTYGNIGDLQQFDFKVDTKAPKVSSMHPTNGITTSDATPHIWASYDENGYTGVSGLSQSNSFLIITYPDSTTETVPASFSNFYMDYYPTVPLPDGLNTMHLGIADNAGNIAENIWSFTVDTTGPAITIDSPIATNYADTTVPLVITTTEQLRSLERSLNGGRYSQLCRYDSCTSPYVGIIGARHGTNVLAVRATDSSGNTNIAYVTFTVD